MSTEQRFWNHVDIKGPDDCWEWKGRRQKNGYGKFRICRKDYRASRKAFEYANPEVEMDARLVCHRCDNPPCCNPKHLWLGTNRENYLDSKIKGRTNHAHPTHCPNGHPRTPDNLVVRGTRGVKRKCRICQRPKDAAKKRRRWQKGKLLRLNLTVLIAYRGLLHAA